MQTLLPSLLACNAGNMAGDVMKLMDIGVSLVHYDVMDGHFVKKISFGDEVLKTILRTGIHADVHLMVTDPADQIPLYCLPGVEMITVHYEAAKEKTALLLQSIREHAIHAGISVNPETDIRAILPFAGYADHILVMGVHPGLGGQKLIPECVDKVSHLRAFRGENRLTFEIEFDGGATLQNAKELYRAGVDKLVAGSALFKEKDWKEALWIMSKREETI